MTDRTHPELTDADLAKIAGTYHAWRGDAAPTADGAAVALSDSEGGTAGYADIPGFCESAKLAEVQKHGHVLTPGRYVGAEAVEDDGEPFDEKMKRLVAQLYQQQAEGADACGCRKLAQTASRTGVQSNRPEPAVARPYT